VKHPADEERLSCSDCLERRPTGRGAGGPTLWEFCRADATSYAHAVRFELRRSSGSLEYRVVSNPSDLPITRVWKAYPWEAVVCLGCLFDVAKCRMFDPRSGAGIGAIDLDEWVR